MSDTLQEREDQIVIEDCKICGYLPHMPWCDSYKEPTVPCSFCSTPTRMVSTKLCDRCWELKTRIENDPDIARRILTATSEHQPATRGEGEEWRVLDSGTRTTVINEKGQTVAKRWRVQCKPAPATCYPNCHRTQPAPVPCD